MPPTVNKICDFLENEEIEDVLKASLKISSKRLVALKVVEDLKGNKGRILIIYDYKYKKRKPKISIPHNQNGFFDFKIYEIDFNKDIDLEKFIISEKEYGEKVYWE